MRSLALAFAALVLGGCSVKLTGAICHADADCPTGQFCVGATDNATGHCEEQGGTAAATSTTSGSSTASSSSSGASSSSSSGSSTSSGSSSSTSGSSGSSGSGGSSSSGGSSGSSGSTGSCPAAGLAVGAGCGNAGDASCAAGALILSCGADDAGCLTWSESGDCGAYQLACKDGDSTCSCPSYAAGSPAVYYVETSAQAWPGSLTHTGAPSPTDCAFKTIDEGMQFIAASDAGASELHLLGASPNPAAWQSGASYAMGALVQPSAPNGHFYQATNAGQSGLVEPTWPTTDGGTVAETTPGTITWAESGIIRVITFTSEPAQAVFPPNVTLINDACSGGGACSPAQYVYPVQQALSAGSALVSLSDGDVVWGLTFRNSSSLAGDLLACGVDGGVQLEALAFDGKPASSARAMDHGLVLSGHCATALNGATFSGFGGAGARVALDDGTAADLVGLDASACDAGLDVASGTVSVAASTLSNNGLYGLLTTPPAGTATLALTVNGLVASNNGLSGLHLRGRGRDAGANEVTFDLTDVDSAANNAGAVAAEAGLTFEHSANLANAAHVFSHGNGYAELYFGADALPAWNTSGGVWDFSHPAGGGSASDPDANRVYCYSSLLANTIGVFSAASNGTNTVVNAQHMWWDTAAPSCGTLSRDCSSASTNGVAVGQPIGAVTDAGCPL